MQMGFQEYGEGWHISIHAYDFYLYAGKEHAIPTEDSNLSANVQSVER